MQNHLFLLEWKEQMPREECIPMIECLSAPVPKAQIQFGSETWYLAKLHSEPKYLTISPSIEKLKRGQIKWWVFGQGWIKDRRAGVKGQEPWGPIPRFKVKDVNASLVTWHTKASRVVVERNASWFFSDPAATVFEQRDITNIEERRRKKKKKNLKISEVSAPLLSSIWSCPVCTSNTRIKVP